MLMQNYFYTHRSEGFGDEIKRRIVMGNFVLSSGYTDAYYKKKARIVLSNKFYEMFEKYDFIITPTSPVLPFKLGETIDNPLTLYNADLCTILQIFRTSGVKYSSWTGRWIVCWYADNCQ